MNAKISVLVICVEVVIYLLLYDLHDLSLINAQFYVNCFIIEICIIFHYNVHLEMKIVITFDSFFRVYRTIALSLSA